MRGARCEVSGPERISERKSARREFLEMASLEARGAWGRRGRGSSTASLFLEQEGEDGVIELWWNFFEDLFFREFRDTLNQCIINQYES